MSRLGGQKAASPFEFLSGALTHRRAGQQETMNTTTRARTARRGVGVGEEEAEEEEVKLGRTGILAKHH